MPVEKLKLKPGFNTEGTRYTAEGGWYSGDKVRFRSGQPERIGGWTRLSGNVFQGICRALHNWVTLDGKNLLGVGTHLKYYIEQGGVYNDITPIVRTLTLGTNPFSSVAGSAVLTVSDPVHGLTEGSFVVFAGASGFDAFTAPILNQEYQVHVVNGNQFTITTIVPALNTASGGGSNVQMQIEVNAGSSVFNEGIGWGAGIWNAVQQFDDLFTNTTGTIGAGDAVVPVASTSGFPSNGSLLIESEIIHYTNTTTTTFTGCTRGFNNTMATNHIAGSVVVSVNALVGNEGWGLAASSGIANQISLWTHDNFGQDLIFALRGGSVFYWPGSNTSFVRGIALSTLATNNGFQGQFVPYQTYQVMTDPDGFVFCFGANSYDPLNANSAFDPLLVRWSDQGNPYQWVPDITNAAGENHITCGSYIVTAQITRSQILVFTDSSLYSLQYVGAPFIWNTDLIAADTITIKSPNSVMTVNNITYWMGMDRFFIYTGRVDSLPCTVRKTVFGDMSQQQTWQTFCGTNEGFSEIWWFYVSQSGEDAAIAAGQTPLVDSYVIYNYLENLWYTGKLNRTAWLDSALRPYPMSTANGIVLFHESSIDDNSGIASQPIPAYLESADFDIGDGHHFGFIWRLLPDISFDGSTAANPQLVLSIKPRRGSGSGYDPHIDKPVVVESVIGQYTDEIFTRVRGRQMSLRVDSNTLGTQWQLGDIRIDLRQDGRR